MENPLWLMLLMLLVSVVMPVMYVRWRMRRRVMQALVQEARRRITEQVLRELRQPGFVQTDASASAEKDS